MAPKSFREALSDSALRDMRIGETEDAGAEDSAPVSPEGGHRKALEFAGVPERVLREMFRAGQQGPFRPDTTEPSKELARRIFRGESLYVWGPRGCGKSHVAACGLLGMRMTRAIGWSEHAWSEWVLTLDALREEVRSDSDESRMRDLCAAKVLVLDDIGPTCRPTPFAIDALRIVVTRRYNDCLQTIVTANLAPDALDASMRAAGFDAGIVEPLVSRLVGGADGGVIHLEGPDRRVSQ